MNQDDFVWTVDVLIGVACIWLIALVIVHVGSKMSQKKV